MKRHIIEITYTDNSVCLDYVDASHTDLTPREYAENRMEYEVAQAERGFGPRVKAWKLLLKSHGEPDSIICDCRA